MDANTIGLEHVIRTGTWKQRYNTNTDKYRNHHHKKLLFKDLQRNEHVCF